MKKIITILVAFAFIIASPISISASTDNYEVYQKINSVINSIEKLDQKHGISISYDLDSFKVDGATNEISFFYEYDGKIIVIDENGYTFSYVENDMIHVYEYYNGEEREFEVGLLSEEDTESTLNRDQNPSLRYVDYETTHSSMLLYFSHYIKIASDYRQRTLGINSGLFSSNNIIKETRITTSPNEQPFEDKADLFLAYLNNVNTLTAGIMPDLKDIATDVFSSAISYAEKELISKEFIKSTENGYEEIKNTFISVTASRVNTMLGGMFVGQAYTFAQSGWDLATVPAVLSSHYVMMQTFNNFKNS